MSYFIYTSALSTHSTPVSPSLILGSVINLTADFGNNFEENYSDG
jgi:hypothetical protein